MKVLHWVVGIAVGSGALALAGLLQRVEPQGPPPAVTEGWRAVDVVTGLRRPWGLAFLPGGGMLITEKGGRLLMLRGTTPTPIPMEGAPAIFSGGQGGLMDVVLHPQFAQNRWVYLTASLGSNRQNRTALLRGRLDGGRLVNVRVLWQNPRAKERGAHFGSRLLWLPDGSLLMSVGDGGNPPASLDGDLIRNKAQDPGFAFGKVLRLTEEGRPASGNPFASRAGALPEVWSIGHRNIQGMARDPRSGRIYASEHGARGGDEVNVLTSGANYGWPLVTFSMEYSGPRISDRTSAPGMRDPIVVWTPCPAPSGLTFYTGDRFPNWRGDLFSGGLAGQDVRRVDLDANGNVLGQQRLQFSARIRDVRQGPDGLLYLLTDEENGRLIRIEPAR